LPEGGARLLNRNQKTVARQLTLVAYTKYVCIMTDYAKDYKACAAP
jgi:hypothetical protein